LQFDEEVAAALVSEGNAEGARFTNGESSEVKSLRADLNASIVTSSNNLDGLADLNDTLIGDRALSISQGESRARIEETNLMLDSIK
jgi:hypothetical protein